MNLTFKIVKICYSFTIWSEFGFWN